MPTLVDRVVRTDQEIGSDFCELVSGGEQQLTHAMPIVAVDALHVLGERVCVHRDLGMSVRAESLRVFHVNGPITKRCPFGGARNNRDMVEHNLLLQRPATAQPADIDH